MVKMRVTVEQKKALVERAMAGDGPLHDKHLKMALSLHPGASATCESAGKWCVWQMEAPDGKRWACCSIIAIKVEWLRGDAHYRDQAIRDAIERMAYGLEDWDGEED